MDNDKKKANKIINLKQTRMSKIASMYKKTSELFFEELENRKKLVEEAKHLTISALDSMENIGLLPEDMSFGDIEKFLGMKREELRDLLSDKGFPFFLFINDGILYTVYIIMTDNKLDSIIVKTVNNRAEYYSEGEWKEYTPKDRSFIYGWLYPNVTDRQLQILKRSSDDPERCFLDALVKKHVLTDQEYDIYKKEYMPLLFMAKRTGAEFSWSDDGEVLLKPEHTVGLGVGYNKRWRLYQF